jgi:FG-GAP-like repeat/FG-GAP repeat
LFDAAVLATYGSVLPAVGLVANINPVEGGLLGTFDITLDGPAPVGGTVVNFTTTGTTATLNLDYRFSPGTGITDVTPNSFTIAAGATKATLNVIALRDTVIDPNEVITINTTGGIGYTIGDFVPKTDFAAGANARSVTTGDFNGDGKLDLATVSGTSGNVSVLLGNGSGGFATKVDFAVGGNPYSVTTGDFNGDGKLDLATANGNSSGTVSVLLGNGSGGFATKVDFAVGTGPYSVTTGDFNGDGKLDLATANYDSNNVSYQFKLSRRRMG